MTYDQNIATVIETLIKPSLIVSIICALIVIIYFSVKSTEDLEEIFDFLTSSHKKDEIDMYIEELVSVIVILIIFLIGLVSFNYTITSPQKYKISVNPNASLNQVFKDWNLIKYEGEDIWIATYKSKYQDHIKKDTEEKE